MTTYPFLQLDVFATGACTGNPVAVVLDAAGALTDEQMQRLANWTNLSETTFMTPLPHGTSGYALRIFTPREELPFAGHPTVGSAHAALHWGVVEPGRFIQRCGLGDIPIGGDRHDGVLVEVGRPTVLPLEPDADELSRLLGTQVDDLRLLDVGPRWLTGRVAHPDDLHAIAPDFAALASFEARHAPATGTTLYAVDPGDGTPHVRSFAPLHGIPEDPVCGSGNLCVSEHLRMFGERSPGDSWVARQGKALGRDGRVHVTLTEDGAWLGRHARIVFSGTASL